MIGKGLGWLIVAIIAGSITFGIGGIIVWIIAGFTANNDVAKRYLHNGWKLVGYEEDGNFTPTEQN